MRILVLQLARFGDIYQTWPVLRALQRTRPDAELHVLVRARFQDALAGFPAATVHAWPTQDILEPILNGDGSKPDEAQAEAIARFERAAEPLTGSPFDLIINLSFSPFSSYLTDFLTAGECEVRGYTRHPDGHFHIPDDSSAYFYAQAGVGRANRYHVTELFAAVAGVDLIDEDHWIEAPRPASDRRGIVVHLGASTEDKTYLPERWVSVLREVLSLSEENVTLVGSAGERPLCQTVAAQAGSDRVLNRAGESTLSELMNWIGSARLVIGADSAPVHMATLTDTPYLNLSADCVNFWETGPRSAGSRVLYAPSLQAIKPERVAQEALAMLKGEGPAGPCAVRESLSSGYLPQQMQFDDFSWRLIEALYTGSEYPKAGRREDALAFQRLFELSELALHQLDRWDSGKTRSTAAQVLAQIDQLLPEITRLNPRIEPAIQWFETERIRIPPGEAQATLARTRAAFENLRWVAAVYREYQEPEQEYRRAAALCAEIVPELREYQFARVQSAVQSLISVLQELARHSTKVGGASWSSVLSDLDTCLSSRDFIAFADFLEWKLAPALRSELTRRETLPPDVLS